MFHTAGSDIDLSLEVDPNSPWYDAKEMGTAGNRGSRGGNRRHQPPRGFKSKKVQLLSKVAGELRYRGFAEVNLIAHARVPLIKLYDPETGVNCDVCVGNDGVYKSAVLGAFADLDERYRDLVFLVKMWAKQFDCNDATAGSFNSFALSLMSLFHLQTRSPPILPPVLRLTLPSDAAADADLAAERERVNNLEPVRKTPVSKIRQQSDAMRAEDDVVEARAASRQRGCGADNTATLAELLVTFFTRRGAALEARPGRVDLRRALGRRRRLAAGRYCVGVEDPFAAGGQRGARRAARSLPKVLSAVRDGTLAMARVCWADSDEDLQRALHDLLGAGARRARGDAAERVADARRRGGNEPLNSPGGAGMSPGRPFGMDAFGGGAGERPRAPPLPPRPEPTRRGAAQPAHGWRRRRAPRDDGDGDGGWARPPAGTRGGARRRDARRGAVRRAAGRQRWVPGAA